MRNTVVSPLTFKNKLRQQREHFILQGALTSKCRLDFIFSVVWASNVQDILCGTIVAQTSSPLNA
jgi:hypothetical protein